MTFTAAMGKRKSLDVYRAPFPLYSVKVDPKTGLVITAGGGGASKTGIKNAVVSPRELFRVIGDQLGVEMGSMNDWLSILSLAQWLLGWSPGPLIGNAWATWTHLEGQS